MKNLLLNTATSSQTEQPFFQSLWRGFHENYFMNDAKYENLNMGSNSLLHLRTILVGFFVGIVLACFGAMFNKRVLGDLVRKLIETESLSSDNAKSLEELGYNKNFFIRYGVKKSVSLRRVVKCVEEEEFYQNAEEAPETKNLKKSHKTSDKFFKVDCDKHHFYIPNELEYTASAKFDKKNSSLLSTVIFLIIMFILMIIAFIAIPAILDMFNDLAGAANSSSNNVLT